MERNSWNIRMNDRNLTDNDKNKAKNSSWGYGNNNHHYHHGDDLLDGFSWPPRSYTCSFCKREFRSAQALGGHMNVHRRDRARLRQSPPWDTQSSSHLDLNPNPNFSSFISTTTVVSAPFTYKVPSLISPSLSCLSSTPSSSKDGNFSNTFNAFKGFTQKDECKKGGMVMLDLEIGLRSSNPNDEELDLELRLGYS